MIWITEEEFARDAVDTTWTFEGLKVYTTGGSQYYVRKFDVVYHLSLMDTNEVVVEPEYGIKSKSMIINEILKEL